MQGYWVPPCGKCSMKGKPTNSIIVVVPPISRTMWNPTNTTESCLVTNLLLPDPWATNHCFMSKQPKSSQKVQRQHVPVTATAEATECSAEWSLSRTPSSTHQNLFVHGCSTLSTFPSSFTLSHRNLGYRHRSANLLWTLVQIQLSSKNSQSVNEKFKHNSCTNHLLLYCILIVKA